MHRFHTTVTIIVAVARQSQWRVKKSLSAIFRAIVISYTASVDSSAWALRHAEIMLKDLWFCGAHNSTVFYTFLLMACILSDLIDFFIIFKTSRRPTCVFTYQDGGEYTMRVRTCVRARARACVYVWVWVCTDININTKIEHATSSKRQMRPL